MAMIKKSTKYKCLSGCGKKETLLHSWEEYKLVQLLWRTVWWFLKKAKNRTYGPGHTSGKDENSNLKKYKHPNVHCGTIYNSQDMKAT